MFDLELKGEYVNKGVLNNHFCASIIKYSIVLLRKMLDEVKLDEVAS